MNFAYVRVSTIEQNEKRQLDALEKYNIDKWFTEKISAKDMNRPMLKQLLEFAREGDKIYIHDFSRLARSTSDLLNIVEILTAKQIELISIKENLDSTSSTGKLMIIMIAAVNEFERTNLLERQREGIAIAKKEGKYKGRKAIAIPDFEQHYEKYICRKKNKFQLANELGVSRPTLDRLIKDFENINCTSPDKSQTARG